MQFYGDPTHYISVLPADLVINHLKRFCVKFDHEYDHAVAIGQTSTALAPYAVALGEGMIARYPGEVKIGPPQRCTAIGWTSTLFLEQHRKLHTPQEYAAIVNWLEYYYD